MPNWSNEMMTPLVNQCDPAAAAAPGTKPVLVILIAGIGDLVLASMALRAVRKGHPHSEIHLLTSTAAIPLAENYPYVDRVHRFPIRELRTERGRLLDIMKTVRDLRKIPFGSILNLYRVSSPLGALKMGALLWLLQGDRKIGHDRYGFGLFLTQSVPLEAFTGRHVAEAMLAVAAREGGIPDGDGIEVFSNAETVSRGAALLAPLAGKVLVGINPGGDRENRRWPPDRFAAVGAEIIRRFNAAVVLLGGAEEVPIAAAIAGRIPSAALNLAGKTSVDALPYVMSRMDLLITNDSGPMHIAAATKTPLVALFGPEDPGLFGPYTSPERYRVIHKAVPCRPCGDKGCRSLSCLDLITVEEVLAACRELLQQRGVVEN